MKTYSKKNGTLLVLQFIFVSLLITTNMSGQITDKLPRSVPESEGVTSGGIVNFINAVDTGRQEIHSFMFIRHGKVIAEGWWNPYGPEYKHVMFSASKTFTATGIGLAVSENKLKLSDKVISFFPYSLPDSIGKNMQELTVQNLLTMSVGQEPAPMGAGPNDDWIKSFFSLEPVHKPGTVFLYNNMATFMLSAIVQQVTGQTLYEYLRPRIFDPLGFKGIDWDMNPQGINLGMIGLRLHTEDMARFGELLIQNGKWNGKQLIPEQWVKEATSFKIESGDPSNKMPKDKNDWAQGYCYQMWRGRNNTVRLDGLAGQFVILIPDKDAIVVLTSNAQNTQEEMNLVHNYLIPAIKSDKAIPANTSAYSELKKRQSDLKIKQDNSKVTTPDLITKISGKEFILGENDFNVQSVYFTFNNGECSFALKRDNSISIVKCGSVNWKMSDTKSSSLLAPARSTSKSIDANYKVLQPTIKVASEYSWTDNNTLEITARFVEESLGAESIICKFREFNGVVNLTIEQKPGTFMGRPTPVMTPMRGTMAKVE
jgi:hypothetical protein